MLRRTLPLLVATAAATATAEEPPAEGPSKKQALVAEKADRAPVRRAEPPPLVPPAMPVTLLNLWTHEALPVDPGRPPPAGAIDRFLRCHFTNQATAMDPRLLRIALSAAARFHTPVIEVISAYRSPKYNLMLRKKGHEVGRDSQHPLGHAVDFRLPGLPIRALHRFVRFLRAGGVGFYPSSSFVHADVGQIRYWKGE